MKKEQRPQSHPAIPLFDLQLSARSRKMVDAVLRGGWLSTGAVATELEEKIKREFQLRHVAAVSSATAGLVAALKAADIGTGDEVIIPSYTFIATAEAVQTVGATVRFADIDPLRWSLDPMSVRKLITKQTKVIIPVDFAGVPAEYRELRSLARAHRLQMISDSAHALGATLGGKPISAFTDFTVVSLHVTKNLTSAEGGLVISATSKNDQRIRLLSRHGITRNAWQRRGKGSVAYDVIASGLKGNLPDLLAAVALGELPEFRKKQQQRTALAARYLKYLQPFAESIQPIVIPEDSTPTWHLFPVLLTKVTRSDERDRVLARMKAEGIECGIHYRPLHTMSLFRNHPDRKELPVTDRIGRAVLILPLYPLLQQKEVDWISDRLVHSLRIEKLL